MENKNLFNSKKGFTLVELLVAISIVAVLSVIGLTAYNGVQARARDVKRLDDAKKIATLLEKYYSEQQSYPQPATCTIGSVWCNSSQTNTPANPWIPGIDASSFPQGLPIDPMNKIVTSSVGLLYWYTSDGSDYCLQISQETDATKNDYYRGYAVASKAWFLRFGPLGPKGGLCNNR